jgi:hypothetical protein
MSHDRTLTRPEAPEVARDPLAGVPAVAAASSGPGAAPVSLGGDAVPWAWATEHRAPERASTQQLVQWLARGELAPHTLVWRPGWGEWLPALQVAELADAFPQLTPGNRRLAQAAPAGCSTPPPVPVGHYPRLRLLAKDVVTGSAPFTAVSWGVAPGRAGRRSLHDLDELQQDVVTSQVPAAAMLEAARAMKALAPARGPTRAERWGQLDLGTFGEAPPRSAAGERVVHAMPEHPPSSSRPPGRSLFPHALELDFSTLPEPELELPWARPRRYRRWVALGLLMGSALGLFALSERTPEAAVPTRKGEDATADEAPRLPLFGTTELTGIGEPERGGELTPVRAPSVARREGFDRVVFEFHERVPSFEVASVDGPSRGCGSREAQRSAAKSWLEVRLHRVYADAASAELAATSVGPALGSIRDVEMGCDVGGVVTWVIGSAPRHRFRAFELADPPRLVVDVEH